MRRVAEGAPSHDAPLGGRGWAVPSCTPLTVHAPSHLCPADDPRRDGQHEVRVRRRLQGTRRRLPGSRGEGALNHRSLVARAHTVGIGQRTYARACVYELHRPCSVSPHFITHPPTPHTRQAAVAVLDAGGTAVEAGAAAKKVLDDSGYQCTPPPRTSSTPRPRLASPALPAGWLPPQAQPNTHTLPPPYPHPPLRLTTCAVGDLTKGAIKGFEGVVQGATGNDDYKFGDVTKNFAKNLFGGLEKGAAAAKKKLDDDAK